MSAQTYAIVLILAFTFGILVVLANAVPLINSLMDSRPLNLERDKATLGWSVFGAVIAIGSAALFYSRRGSNVRGWFKEEEWDEESEQ